MWVSSQQLEISGIKTDAFVQLLILLSRYILHVQLNSVYCFYKCQFHPSNLRKYIFTSRNSCDLVWMCNTSVKKKASENSEKEEDNRDGGREKKASAKTRVPTAKRRDGPECTHILQNISSCCCILCTHSTEDSRQLNTCTDIVPWTQEHADTDRQECRVFFSTSARKRKEQSE